MGVEGDRASRATQQILPAFSFVPPQYAISAQ
jgi:hypothetical protein